MTSENQIHVLRYKKVVFTYAPSYAFCPALFFIYLYVQYIFQTSFFNLKVLKSTDGQCCCCSLLHLYPVIASFLFTQLITTLEDFSSLLLSCSLHPSSFTLNHCFVIWRTDIHHCKARVPHYISRSVGVHVSLRGLKGPCRCPVGKWGGFKHTSYKFYGTLILDTQTCMHWEDTTAHTLHLTSENSLDLRSLECSSAARIQLFASVSGWHCSCLFRNDGLL